MTVYIAGVNVIGNAFLHHAHEIGSKLTSNHLRPYKETSLDPADYEVNELISVANPFLFDNQQWIKWGSNLTVGMHRMPNIFQCQALLRGIVLRVVCRVILCG